VPKKPNDRPREKALRAGAADPRLYVVVDGEKFPRPGLETVFVDARPGQADAALVTAGCACKPVAIPVCACLKVCQCVPVCSCVGHTRSTGTTTYGCRCAPVH
jgi:hypothetical protein